MKPVKRREDGRNPKPDIQQPAQKFDLHRLGGDDKKRGDQKYHRADTKQADRKKVARDEPIRVKVLDPPTVSQERFDRVQQILDEKNAKWRRQRVATVTG